jgi:hypothetical protein
VAAEPSRQSESADELRAERDFFLRRAIYGDWTWVGLSSNAMLAQAVTGADRPTEYPRDSADLARCEKTYELAPEHLKPRMLRTLGLFRRMVKEGGLLWCFTCDHGGHSTTWSDLCERHAEEAGIDTRPRWERAA